MKHIKKKTLQLIIIFTIIIIASMANSSGFIFKWEPFVFDNNIFLDPSGEKVFTNDLSVFGLEVPIAEDYKDMPALSSDQDNFSTQKSEKKSVWENIKLKISTTDRLMTNIPEKHSNIDDEKISNFINAVSSLIYNDSKIKSLENIGTIIEPQINFYFEF